MAPYNRRRRNLQCYLAVLSITIAAATALSACGGVASKPQASRNTPVSARIGTARQPSSPPSWSGPLQVDANNSCNVIQCALVQCPTAAKCIAIIRAQTGLDAYVGTAGGDAWSRPTLVVTDPTDDYGVVPGGLSCPTTRFCVLTAGNFNGGLSDSGENFAYIWNGSTWSAGFGLSSLDNDDDAAMVSCASPDFCMASGQGHATELWNGSTWTDTPPAADQIVALACASTHWCIAIGYTSGDESTEYEQWDGSHWTQPSLIPISPGADKGNIVTCITKTSCIAVTDSNTGGFTTSTALWDGSSWATKRPQVLSVFIGAVSCATNQMCMAAGSGSAIWDGSRWSVLGSSPQSVSDVSCPSPSRCVAVGGRGDIYNWS